MVGGGEVIRRDVRTTTAIGHFFNDTILAERKGFANALHRAMCTIGVCSGLWIFSS